MKNKIQKGPSLIFEFPAKIFLLPVSVLELSYYIYCRWTQAARGTAGRANVGLCSASSFYRAMLSIRGTSHGPVSVRLSVTSRSSIETTEGIELVFGT